MKLISIPINSIALGFGILGGGIVDIYKSIVRSFKHGPQHELGEYLRSIEDYVRRKLGKTKKKKRRSKRRRNDRD